ncbi:hypothetical protein LZ31DRAFT_158376 [Colletotrichum somersetense]|nr:hypothetical protein LZ31DRAFT_158376 [Colletotrichum somersetense]
MIRLALHRSALRAHFCFHFHPSIDLLRNRLQLENSATVRPLLNNLIDTPPGTSSLPLALLPSRKIQKRVQAPQFFVFLSFLLACLARRFPQHITRPRQRASDTHKYIHTHRQRRLLAARPPSAPRVNTLRFLSSPPLPHSPDFSASTHNRRRPILLLFPPLSAA